MLDYKSILFNKMKIIETIRAHLQTNFQVPHPTLIAIGISVAISTTAIGIFYLADSSGMFGREDAEAKARANNSGNYG